MSKKTQSEHWTVTKLPPNRPPYTPPPPKNPGPPAPTTPPKIPAK